MRSVVADRRAACEVNALGGTCQDQALGAANWRSCPIKEQLVILLIALGLARRR